MHLCIMCEQHPTAGLYCQGCYDAVSARPEATGELPRSALIGEPGSGPEVGHRVVRVNYSLGKRWAFNSMAEYEAHEGYVPEAAHPYGTDPDMARHRATLIAGMLGQQNSLVERDCPPYVDPF